MFSTNLGKIDYSIKIDPCHMSETETALLGYFLAEYRKSSKGKQIIADGVRYSFPSLAGIEDTQSHLYQLMELFIALNMEIITITLTHPLIMRGLPGNPQSVRYDIYSGDILGEGNYGCVANVAGVLKVQKDNSIKFTSKSRVSKIQNENDSNIWNEFNLTNRVKRFGLKQPVFLSSDVATQHLPVDGKLQPMLQKLRKQNCAILVMKRLAGKDLEKIIAADKDGSARLTTDMRLQLCIAVLRSLQEDVHNRSIVHRDVKTGNIIGDLTRDPVQTTHIDFGLSRDARTTSSNEFMVGTPIYFAPEVFFNHPQDENGDVYTVSWVLQMLLGGDDTNSETVAEAVAVAKNRDFSSLFRGIHDLDASHQTAIRNMLIQMTLRNPNARYTLDDAIFDLEKIVLARKCKNFNNLEKVLASKSYSVGRDLGKLCSQAINSTRLKEIVENGLKCIGDDPLSVSFFIDGLNEMIFRMEQSRVTVLKQADSIAEILDLIDSPAKVFFRPLKTKSAIRTVFDNLLAAYTANQKELKALANHPSMQRDAYLWGKVSKLAQLTIQKLDDIALFNDKCAKHFPALRACLSVENRVNPRP